jgi:ABC-type sugar transport system permease subunit
VASNAIRARQFRQLPTALALLAPSLLVLVTFVIYPLVRAVLLGRQRCDSRGERCVTNGWDQYVDAFRSVEFQHALWVTIKLALLTVPLGLLLGVALAMLADKHLRGVGIFRAVFSSTVATSVAVTSLMWLLQPNVGVLSNIGWIGKLFPVVKNPGLLQDAGTALPAVAMSSVWASLGFTFILVTAGLQSIPAELHEAAAIDGASNARRFWHVTLPGLAPTLLFIVVVLTSRALQMYGEVDLLTGGGPRPDDSTTTITYLTYGSNSIIPDEGLQATSAVLLFVVMLAVTAVQLRVVARQGER